MDGANEQLDQGFSLGGRTVWPLTGVIERDGERVHVEPKVMDVLLCLVRHQGQVVTRSMLMDEVWGRIVVTDDSLTRCISELRTLLGDTGRERRFIRTVPKRGYSLVQTVEPLIAPEMSIASARRHRTGRWLLAGLVMTFAGLALMIKMFGQNSVGRGAVLPVADAQAGIAAPFSSLAVLPFVNLSGDSHHDGFTQGLAEDIRNTMLTSTSLRVAGRTSSRAYLDRAVDVREIGKQLGVDALLEGTVRISGDRVRVTAQLSDVGGAYAIWAGSFERELGDALQAQVDLAAQIVGRLTPGSAASSTSAVTVTTSLKAHEYYLLGRHHWHARTGESVSQAIGLFEQARTLDPEYALAFSGLADALIFSANYGDAELSEVTSRALPMAERALELDPKLGEAHASMGLVLEYLGDKGGARLAYQKAVELQPNYSMARMWLGNAWMAHGDLNRALEQYQAGVDLDPLHPQVQFNYVEVLLERGQFEAARQAASRFHRSSQNALVLTQQLNVLAKMGKYDEVLNLAVSQNYTGDFRPYASQPVVESLIMVGRYDEAARMLDDNQRQMAGKVVPELRAMLAMAQRNSVALREAATLSALAHSKYVHEPAASCKRSWRRLWIAVAEFTNGRPGQAARQFEEIITLTAARSCHASFPAGRLMARVYAMAALELSGATKATLSVEFEAANAELRDYRERGWNPIQLAVAEFALRILEGDENAALAVLIDLQAQGVQPWALVEALPLFDVLRDRPAMRAAAAQARPTHEILLARCADIGLAKLGL